FQNVSFALQPPRIPMRCAPSSANRSSPDFRRTSLQGNGRPCSAKLRSLTFGNVAPDLAVSIGHLLKGEPVDDALACRDAPYPPAIRLFAPFSIGLLHGLGQLAGIARRHNPA